MCSAAPPGAGAGGAGGASAAGLSSVEVPPAVPEVPEPGTCSLLDADVAPHWPAKPGVYIRGAFTRQMGQQQLTSMGGGARWAPASLYDIRKSGKALDFQSTTPNPPVPGSYQASATHFACSGRSCALPIRRACSYPNSIAMSQAAGGTNLLHQQAKRMGS